MSPTMLFAERSASRILTASHSLMWGKIMHATSKVTSTPARYPVWLAGEELALNPEYMDTYSFGGGKSVGKR